MLTIDLKVNESIAIGSYAIITLEEKSGKVARIAIQADRSVPITRVNPTTVATIAARGGITSKV